MKKYNDIHWLDDNRYAKALFHLRGQVNDALSIFRAKPHYGNNVYVDGAVDEIVQACEDFSLVTRGIDKIIKISDKKNTRYVEGE